jgi:hypothetical protein
MPFQQRSNDPTRRFLVRAEPLVGLGPRVLGEFAKRDLLPDLFEARVTGGELDLRVDCRGLDDATAAHVALVLANLPGVCEARLLPARSNAVAA